MYDAKNVMNSIYAKDLALNSTMDGERVLHRHIFFFGKNMKYVFNDCCGNCPIPSSPEEIAIQIENDKIFTRGWNYKSTQFTASLDALIVL
ncbi:hypothetical protein C1645_818871 [Glomus cerebriforme]|uniref:Uncharacterized protein n=1 Tax=Glomus cerebriforme TaxID=658196 RepID=A0A397T7H2_9GLOM|nr:hypothetical protein C1645_818871 [Glomus cerebriforme]